MSVEMLGSSPAWTSDPAWVALGLVAAILLVATFLAAMPWLERDDSRVRGVAFVIATFLAIRYCGWRVSLVISAPVFDISLALAYAYCAFECYMMSTSIRNFRNLVQFIHRHKEADDHMGWLSDRDVLPVVDFLIPTYNENQNVLERAIVGGLSQEYPRVRVWVLDDGKREWLRDLAARKGAHYLTRPDNVGFKAGNLNHALEHIRKLDEPSEFVAVLDCDFVASPSFATRTLALMYDESVAIVQTKQVYFNQDPFQYALSLGRWLPDWQRSAFDFGAPTRDARGAQYCCGTCFLARRSSLERIGGVPTESVAEDRLMTYALDASGLRTIYLNEGHSYGIVAEGLREFLTQCGRWSLGIVQNIYSPWGGASPGKSLWQRIRFFEGSVYWSLTCWAKVLQMWLPIIFWFFGPSVFPILGTGSAYLAHFLPYWLFSLATNWWLARGAAGQPLLGDAMALLQAPVVFRATYRGLVGSKNHRFVVTDKGMLRDRTRVHWYSLKWLVLVGGLTLAGLAYAILDPYAACHESPMLAYAYFWSFYNLLAIATAARICVEPAQRREDVRFATDEYAWVAAGGTTCRVKVLDISMGGVSIQSETRLDVGQEVTVRLDGMARILSTVLRRSPDGRVALGLAADEDQRADLIRRLYSPAYVKCTTVGRFSRIYRAVLANVFV